MLVQRRGFAKHAPWVIACSLAAIAASIWYGWHAQHSVSWPTGSSMPGLLFGVVAAGIIIFEMLLWPRKRLRAWRIGRAESWMRAHIWLGLLSAPLVLLHTGFRWGGQFSSVLAWIYIVVIVSGVLGLIVQNVIPRVMLRSLPAETIFSQIENVASQFARDAERKVDAVCSRTSSASSSGLQVLAEERDTGPIVIGAVRNKGSFRGKVLMTEAPPAPLAHPQPLEQAFDSTIRPYLYHGRRAQTELTDRREAEMFFRALRDALEPEAASTVNELEELCEQRRQFDVQARLHWLLHSWIAAHVGLSVILVILLAVHVVVAIRYW